MLRIRGLIILAGKVLQALKLIGQGFISFHSKTLVNCVTFQSKLLAFKLSFPFRSFVKSSVASIGKGYPFRKNPRFDAMRQTGIFCCWGFPKPLCVLSLNIPSSKRLLLHFAPHYIQRCTFDFAKATREFFK